MYVHARSHYLYSPPPLFFRFFVLGSRLSLALFALSLPSRSLSAATPPLATRPLGHSAARRSATGARADSSAAMAASSAATFVAGGALAIGNLVVGTSLVHAALGRGAPFVPTAATKIDALFGEGGLLRRGSSLLRDGTYELGSFIDMGSGDGALVRAASQRAGFRSAIGYELNPWLVGYSHLRSAGRGHREATRWISMWDASLSEAAVVLVYGSPPIMERLGDKLKAELPIGALVVSNCYELPRSALGPPVRSVFVDTHALAPDASSYMHVYRKE